MYNKVYYLNYDGVLSEEISEPGVAGIKLIEWNRIVEEE